MGGGERENQDSSRGGVPTATQLTISMYTQHMTSGNMEVMGSRVSLVQRASPTSSLPWIDTDRGCGPWRGRGGDSMLDEELD